MKIVVVGIGTDVGKTIASAALVHIFQSHYWKPVQTGDIRDSETIRNLCPPTTIVYKEAYHYREPASPHHSAALENCSIDPDKIVVPNAERLVIETAGGILVPLNEDGVTNADLLQRWKFPVIVVTRNYLGSINHTLLTLSELYRRSVNVLALIISGDQFEPGERIYKKLYPEIPHLHLPKLHELSAEALSAAVKSWNLCHLR